MPISLKLPVLDDNPILLAETRANKINEFLQNLPFGDPIRAATDLVEELQILNSQKVAFSNRINALELYRPVAVQIYQELIPRFSSASLPISKNELAFAHAAEQLWQEFAYGYKSALVDLQNKILNLNSEKSTALVVQRAIHALKEMVLVTYLTYRTPSPSLWAELHQLYFCALHQSAEKFSVNEYISLSNESSVNAVYLQVLLMSLANPHHLANQDIIKTEAYLTKIAGEAELRPLGLIDNPTGVFLIGLNSNKPPMAFVKNREVPNGDTDILLVTINLARRIHTHLKLLQDGVLPNDGSLANGALEHHDEDLLTHLIKHFGKSPQRIFSRTKKSDGIELGVSVHAAHHFISKIGNDFSLYTTLSQTLKPSRWQVLNVGAGGYALRKFNSSQAEVYVGDIAAIKNNKTLQWELGVLRWANMNELNQLDVGIELISPSVSAITIATENNAVELEGLLLSELSALKQPASIIVQRDTYKPGQLLQLIHENSIRKITFTKLIERTSTFERFQYSLI
ncbi:MAG: hypothetical protein ACT4OH_01280 [Methylophilaceae bacterium]